MKRFEFFVSVLFSFRSRIAWFAQYGKRMSGSTFLPFHGGSGCSHSHGLCGSHGDSEENDDSQSCPVVLYGQGLESPDYFITPMVLGSFFQGPNPAFNDLQWSSHKHDSFGARDPPHRA